MNGRFRLAIVNSHPIQYFAPMYAYLNRDPGLEVTALYCSNFSLRGGVDAGFGRAVTWDVNLLDGYRHKFVGARASLRTPAGFWSLVCPGLWREIRGGQYDAVLVHGYGYAAYVLAMLAAKTCGVPVFLRTETHLGLKRSAVRRGVRDAVLAIAFRYVDGFLAIGSANRAYYRALGVPDSKIHDVPYAVDNSRFLAASKLTADERARVRHRYGAPPDQPLILYASKLVPRKHPDDLIRALALLHAEGVRATLLIVGTGEMESGLRQLASTMEYVRFGGFVNQTELPRVLAAADVFALPADNEPWGLVVNEAMCAGLPVIVGNQVGCVPDLVRDGETGLLVRPGDVKGLASALRRLLLHAEARHAMGTKGLNTVANWNYERCLVGVRSAMAAVRK